MTPDQTRLLHELHDRRIIGLADAPDYWCRQIRDTNRSTDTSFARCAKDDQWREQGYGFTVYPWGLAMTTPGDATKARKVSDPAHVATLTWSQMTRWSESLTDEQRATARRGRNSIHVEDEQAVVAQLFAPAPAVVEAEEMTLW